MKTKAEIKFGEIIKSCFHEKLKPLGFKKKANNFYRDLGEVGHIINVQKSMFRSKEYISFTANIGIYSPIYWNSEFNFNGDPEPPQYPVESVSIIRKRIGSFIEGSDKWYDVEQYTNINPIKSELSGILEEKVIPYFDQFKDNDSLLNYLDNEFKEFNSNYIRFVMHGELGNTNKVKEIYPILIKECTKHQTNHINERAVKFGIKIDKADNLKD